MTEKMYQVSLTFSYRHAEADECYSRGYVYSGEWISYDELMQELELFVGGETSSWPIARNNCLANALWVSRAYTDPYTGIETEESLHIHAIGTRAKHRFPTNAQIAKLYETANIIDAKRHVMLTVKNVRASV